MAKTAKSSVLGKLSPKAKAAFDKAKTEEMVPDSGGRLPGGIGAGIAQLSKCGFALFKQGANQGKPYFMASGIVFSPTHAGDVPIKGLRTQLGPVALCDTKNGAGKVTTEAEHVAEVLNVFKRLGVDTSELEFSQWEETAAALEEEKPFFRFRTSEGKTQTSGPYKGKPPRVFENWGEVCEYDPEGGDEVVDETASDDDAPAEDDTTEAGDEEQDLDALAEAADAEDGDAQLALTELATPLGIDPESIDTWAEVVEAIRAAQEGGEDQEEEASDDGEEFVPEKSSIYKYKSAKQKKAAEWECIAVNEDNGTCSMKDVATKVIVKGVGFGELEVIE